MSTNTTDKKTDRLAKLKQLQKRKAEASKQNRQELFKEHKQQQVGTQSLKSLEQRKGKAQEELQAIEMDEQSKGSYERRKGWDYSIEDHEKWDEKIALKGANSGNAGFVNYSQLAEQSYKKEISQLVVDKESYEKQKKHNGKDDDDFSHKPSKESINKLMSTLKGADARRMQRRKNYDDTDNYINTKNKQFNDKLDRHYDKYE